jgi:hypothetical protein
MFSYVMSTSLTICMKGIRPVLILRTDPGRTALASLRHQEGIIGILLAQNDSILESFSEIWSDGLASLRLDPLASGVLEGAIVGACPLAFEFSRKSVAKC